MKARELMTRCPDVITPDDSITAAAEVMHYANDAFVPVVADASRRILVGVITARDIVTRCVARHHSLSCRVRDHMTPTPVHSLALDDDVIDAAKLMVDWEVRRIPVLTPDGVLAGVIHESDLRRELARIELNASHQESHMQRDHRTADSLSPAAARSLVDGPASSSPPFARR